MEKTVADLTRGGGFQGTRASTLFKGLTEARRNNKNQFRDRDPNSFHKDLNPAAIAYLLT